MKKKILAFTGCRSDYDLLSGLFHKLAVDPDLDFKLLVSGAHLSEEHGMTVKMIEADKLPILAKVETLSTPTPALKLFLRPFSAAHLFEGALAPVINFKPDLIICAGDREDVIIAAIIATYLDIPCAHFFGGDHGYDGHVDHNIRHATSKLAHIHFASTQEHYDRLVALGENPQRIFLVGSSALDKFREEPELSSNDVFQAIGVKMQSRFALLIYHPMPEVGMSTSECFENILKALAAENIFTLVSQPNIDKGNEEILAVIEKYKDHKNFHFYQNLDRNHFINLMRHAEFMIGNSSAGLVEAPIVPLSAINVGERQRGRASTTNILFKDGQISSIRAGIQEVQSPEFRRRLKDCKSPYGDGHSVEKSYKIIKSLNFSNFWKKPDDALYPNKKHD